MDYLYCFPLSLINYLNQVGYNASIKSGLFRHLSENSWIVRVPQAYLFKAKVYFQTLSVAPLLFWAGTGADSWSRQFGRRILRFTVSSYDASSIDYFSLSLFNYISSRFSVILVILFFPDRVSVLMFGVSLHTF